MPCFDKAGLSHAYFGKRSRVSFANTKTSRRGPPSTGLHHQQAAQIRHGASKADVRHSKKGVILAGEGYIIWAMGYLFFPSTMVELLFPTGHSRCLLRCSILLARRSNLCFSATQSLGRLLRTIM